MTENELTIEDMKRKLSAINEQKDKFKKELADMDGLTFRDWLDKEPERKMRVEKNQEDTMNRIIRKEHPELVDDIPVMFIEYWNMLLDCKIKDGHSFNLDEYFKLKGIERVHE